MNTTNKTFDELYLEYLELKKAKEKAEEVVIRNTIKATVKAKEDKTKAYVKQLEEYNKRLDLINY